MGFIEVGKGRSAGAPAIMTGMFAVDCDDLIESLTKMKIKDIGRHAERIPHYRRVADSEIDVAGLSADAIAGWIRTSMRKKTLEK